MLRGCPEKEETMSKNNRKQTREIQEQLAKEEAAERKKTGIILAIGVAFIIVVLAYAIYERVFVG